MLDVIWQFVGWLSLFYVSSYGVITVRWLQAVLGCRVGLELPSFLLVSFIPAMQIGIEEPNSNPRTVCAASAATILRALITAGKARMASSMIEDYLLECALAS